MKTTAQQSSADGARKRRRRRRRGKGDDRPQTQGQRSAETPRPRVQTTQEPMADDAGWSVALLDPEPISPGISVPLKRPDTSDTDDDSDDYEAPPLVRWGDDSEAPTPEVTLPDDGHQEAADPTGEDVFHESAELKTLEGTLINQAIIKFSPAGKFHPIDAGDGCYVAGDKVMVETDKGVQPAIVALPPVRREIKHPMVKRILRKLDKDDRKVLVRNKEKAKETLRMAKAAVRKRRLKKIKMFRVDILPDGSRATFYFSSEDRIDFRDLARDLAQKSNLRIDMRQTGVRDEAKLVGGIGSCGQELCCSTFLPCFEPVSIKMAKDQGLVLNPSKVSGQCGRLKCCLVYEQAIYHEMRKGLPKLGKRVTTERGEGRVAEVDVLRQRIRVSYGPGDFEVYRADEVTKVIPQPQPPKARGEGGGGRRTRRKREGEKAT